MDLDQCNFLTENIPLEIIPRFNQVSIDETISGQYGPFEAGVSLQVPTWIAMMLKKKQKCRICPPEWFTVENLQAVCQAETDSEAFTAIPERFFELTHILITRCKEDFENLEQLRTLVKDIWDKRSSKLRTSTMALFHSEKGGCMKMDKLTQFEIAHIREFMVDASSTLGKLSNVYLSIDDEEN